MDTWEYATVTVSNGGLRAAAYIHVFRNGAERPEGGFLSDNKELEALTKAGNEGWELVSSTTTTKPDGKPDGKIHYLKRKKSA